MEIMSNEERAELLELYKNLRVADVRDGMDWHMMHYFGSVSPSIRPLFRTRAYGIAHTVRYLPFQGPIPWNDPKGYTEWTEYYYGNVCTYPWEKEVRDGDFMAIDLSGLCVGLMGSDNSLKNFANGVRGYVINGGVRDTDEVILQEMPVWSSSISQSMVQGRIQFESMDQPVNIGGVVVYPGDMIVADGDGVIVVPRKMAKDVAKQATFMLAEDKVNRGKSYEKLGWQKDETVV